MLKLKKFMLLIPLLTMSLLFTSNTVWAVSENSEGNTAQSVSDNSDSDTAQSVSDNSDSNTAQSVSDNSVSDNTQAADDTSDSDIVRLVCPTEYPFFIARSSGEAAYLNSEIFHIANYSNKDVLIDLSNIHLKPGENVSYNELSAPMEKNYASDTKDVFGFLKVVDIDPNNVPSPDSLNTGEIPPEGASPSEGDFILTGEHKTTDYKVLLKASNYNEEGEFVSFQPESIFSFYIAGNVTPNTDLTWNAGDISIKVIINYSVVPSEEIETSDADTEESAEAKKEDSPNADEKEITDSDKEQSSDDNVKKLNDTGTEEAPDAETPDAKTEELPDVASLTGSEAEGKDDVKDSDNKDDKVKPDTTSNVEGIENKKQ